MTVTSLRICVATTSYPRTPSDDAAIFVERLVKGFEAVGIEGEVVVPFDEGEQMIERRGSFVIRRFKYGIFSKGRVAFGAGILPNLRRDPSLWIQVPGLLLAFAASIRRSRNASVVHANWLFASIAAFFVRVCGGPPVVVTCRGEDAKLIHIPVIGFLLVMILRRCAAIVAVSEAFRIELIAAGIPEDRVIHIPNGVEVLLPSQTELARWAKERDVALSRKWLVTVGRVIPLKRIHEVIRVLQGEGMEDFSLLICGRMDDSNYVATLEDLITELGLEERVRFEGAVSPRDIPYYLSAARYFVSLSEYEGRPNAVVEAMSAGVPCIVSNIAAHREIVWDGKTAVIVSSIDQAIKEIVRLEKEPHQYLRISHNAKGAFANYGWTDAAKRYRAVFERAKERT